MTTMPSPCKKQKTEDSSSQALADLPALLAQREPRTTRATSRPVPRPRQALAEENGSFRLFAAHKVKCYNSMFWWYLPTSYETRVLTWGRKGRCLAAQFFRTLGTTTISRGTRMATLFVDQSALSFQRIG